MAPVRAFATACLLFLLSGSLAGAATPAMLPVYIEDSHAGAFCWIIKNLLLDRDYQLILIDAHSDANEIPDSDSLRQAILRAVSGDRLEDVIKQWRERGAIQSFNWIEPLMPHPISDVLWIPAGSLSKKEIDQHCSSARKQLNAHEAALPRKGGDFSKRYQVSGLDRLDQMHFNKPLIVSIDLDYFASLSGPSAIHEAIVATLDRVFRLRNLQSITFAISRPYLKSDDQAHSLVTELLRYLVRVVNVEIQFEPFANAGEDRSEMAKDFYRRKMNPPLYDIENAPTALRTLILQNMGRITISEQKQRWQQLFLKWQSDDHLPRILLSAEGLQLDHNNEYEVEAGRPFNIFIENYDKLPSARIRWRILASSKDRYNLAGADQGYADGAEKFLMFQEQEISNVDNQREVDSSQLIPYFDKKTGWGSIRIYAEVSDGAQTYISNILRISRFHGEGYLGALTRIFNLPYIYGSAKLNVEGKVSADAYYGADCSNFIIFGRRRQGFSIPYLKPKDLLAYLAPVTEFSSIQNGIAYDFQQQPIRFSPDLLKRGLLLYLGKHIAAVFDDGRDTGVLTENTPIIHQLETYAEIIPFSAFAAKYHKIQIMTFKENLPK